MTTPFCRGVMPSTIGFNSSLGNYLLPRYGAWEKKTENPTVSVLSCVLSGLGPVVWAKKVKWEDRCQTLTTGSKFKVTIVSSSVLPLPLSRGGTSLASRGGPYRGPKLKLSSLRQVYAKICRGWTTAYDGAHTFCNA